MLTGLYANTSFEWESLKYKILTTPSMQLFMFMIFTNSVVPLSLFFKKVRGCPVTMAAISFFLLIGMWLERYLIVPNSLSRKFLPWMWTDYHPSWIEVSITVGAICFFVSMFMVFIKIFPVVSLFEAKEDAGIPMEKEGH